MNNQLQVADSYVPERAFSGSVPQNLQYTNFGLKPSAIKGVKTRRRYIPTGSQSGYNGSTNRLCQIEVATSPNAVIDTSEAVLHFTLTATSGTNPMYLEQAGAYSAIKRLTVRHNGEVLSNIDNYNVLMGVLHDVQLPPGQKPQNAGFGVMNGLFSNTVDNSTTTTCQAYAWTTGGNSFGFSIPLLGSPILNLHQNGGLFLPTCFLQRLQIEIEWEQPENVFMGIAGTTVASYSIDNIYWEAPTIEIEPQMVEALKQALIASQAGKMYLSCNDFLTTVFNTGNSSSATYSVASRAKSARSIYLKARPTGALGTVNGMAHCGSEIRNLQAQINNTVYPPYKLDSSESVMSEAYFTAGMSKQLGSLNKLNFEDATSTSVFSSGAIQNRAVGGLDLDSYHGSVASGMDISSGIPVYITCDFASQATRQISTFVFFDAVLVIDLPSRTAMMSY